MSDDKRYARHYFSILTDPKFEGIYEDDRAYATWGRMLFAAEGAWPAPADIPRSAHPKTVALLASRGLIDLLPGHRFRMHGLDAERSRRRNAARIGAAAKWHSNGESESDA